MLLCKLAERNDDFMEPISEYIEEVERIFNWIVDISSQHIIEHNDQACPNKMYYQMVQCLSIHFGVSYL